MITFSLQSGSNGNAIYVEAGDTRLLFDAGISGKQAEGRMRARGREIRDIDAVIISHDHSDHVRCAGIYQRKFKLPVYMTQATWQRTAPYQGEMTDVRHFRAGEPLQFGDVTVHSLSTPHDAADGVVFVIEHERRRLGILTDLGHPFAMLKSLLCDLHAVYLESNYDPEMLAYGPYPYHLKERIRGRRGHISNDEAALLLKAAGSRLQWAALSHLSEQNNCPDLAMDSARRRLGQSYPLRLASRYEVGEVMDV